METLHCHIARHAFWSQKMDSHRFFNLIVCDRTCAFWLQIGLWINFYRGFWLLSYTIELVWTFICMGWPCPKELATWFGHRKNFVGSKKKSPLEKGAFDKWKFLAEKNPGCWKLWNTEPCKRNNHWQTAKLERTTFDKGNVRKRRRFWKTCLAEVAQGISEYFVQNHGLKGNVCEGTKKLLRIPQTMKPSAEINATIAPNHFLRMSQKFGGFARPKIKSSLLDQKHLFKLRCNLWDSDFWVSTTERTSICQNYTKRPSKSKKWMLILSWNHEKVPPTNQLHPVRFFFSPPTLSILTV